MAVIGVYEFAQTKLCIISVLNVLFLLVFLRVMSRVDYLVRLKFLWENQGFPHSKSHITCTVVFHNGHFLVGFTEIGTL